MTKKVVKVTKQKKSAPKREAKSNPLLAAPFGEMGKSETRLDLSSVNPLVLMLEKPVVILWYPTEVKAKAAFAKVGEMFARLGIICEIVIGAPLPTMLLQSNHYHTPLKETEIDDDEVVEQILGQSATEDPESWPDEDPESRDSDIEGE